MKKTIVSVLVLVGVIIIILFSLNSKEGIDIENQTLYSNTIDISREYIDLRLKTDDILLNTSSYSSYELWNKDILKIIDNWKDFELKTVSLEEQVVFYENKKISINFINKTETYSKEEISNVFDNAKAWQKIKTLAKYLWVDAKRAYKILQNDQEFVKADAWNEAGDTFKKLEVSAIVIKDGCKVAGFVGGIIISGWTAWITWAGVLGQTGIIVSGADLVLEIWEDSATIGLWDDSKVTKFFSSFRSITDPAASILSLWNIPGNLKTWFDKFGGIMFGADQLRSVVQDGKLLGINISDNSKIEISSLDKKDVKGWIEKETKNDWTEEDQEELDGFMDEYNKHILEEENNEIDIKMEESNETEEWTENQEIKWDNEQSNIKEDKYKRWEKVYAENGKAYISIIDSKEQNFLVSQTQFWKWEVVNYIPGEYIMGKGYNCYWTYYLNGVEVWSQKNTCAHTCSPVSYKHINGWTLKVELKVEFLKVKYGIDEFWNKKIDGKEIAETLIAEQFYEVLPTPVDTHVYWE